VTNQKVGVYFAWNRTEETSAPLGVIEDRFPALFESRRILYPRLQELADPDAVEQGIAGFIEEILMKNFTAFLDDLADESGRAVIEHERVDRGGSRTLLEPGWVSLVDTLVIISFDSLRTRQTPRPAEIDTVRAHLAKPGNLLIVSPHHDIGQASQESEFLHHGDRTIPPRQGFGGFARSLLASLGVPVENRFGLRPAVAPDGSPAPIEADYGLDRMGLLDGVRTFNAHPHLPHLHRIGDANTRLDVLARQTIDPSAPPHAFTADGRTTFDAMLQSRAGVFEGDLLVTDATLWSSTAGGVASLRRLWSNIVQRRRPS
jgi:hypothetical protein